MANTACPHCLNEWTRWPDKNNNGIQKNHGRKLTSAAYELADEIRDGKWNAVFNPASTPVTECDSLVLELEKRCPGHTRNTYSAALAQGMFESR